MVINITPPFVFNSTHGRLSYHKCKKKFCHHKILANFHIKSPSFPPSLVPLPSPFPPTPLKWKGKHKPCTIKLLSHLVRNNMESYYPCNWLSLVNQKNEKIRNWSLLMKIISCVLRAVLLKTTDLYTVYLFCEYADN